MHLNLWQRFGLAFVFLLVFAGLGRGVGASLIAARGDEFTSPKNFGYSIRFYERALALDPQSHDAVRGLVSTLYMIHTPTSLRSANAVAGGFLRAYSGPHDAFYDDLLERRALTEMLLGDYGEAEGDFRVAALDTHSGKDADLAADAALRLGDRVSARALLALAQSLDPNEVPSARQRALAGIR